MGKNNTNNLLRYSGLATTWMLALGAATWLGWKSDKWLKNDRIPILTILLPLVTLVILMWKLVKDFSKPNE